MSAARIRALIGVALAALALSAGAAALPAPASTFEATVVDVAATFDAEGTVEAVRQSTIAAQVSGRIVELAVKAGDRVRAGQLIARIDPRTANEAVAASRSQIAEAEANLANATRRHERNLALLAQKFVSQAVVDQSQAELKAAQAQLDAAKAGSGSAIAQQTYTTIVAPYAGIVGATQVELGDMASPGKAIATVFDPAALRVVATLPQSELARWQRALPIVVDIPSLGRPLAPSAVTVVPLADARSHTVRVRLDLPVSDGLLPGQYARVAFPTGSQKVLAIPSTAILRRGELSAVYVLTPDGRPTLRQIRLGESYADGRTEVLSGLSPGDRVASHPVAAGIVAAEQRR